MAWLQTIGVIIVLCKYSDEACQPDVHGLPRFGPGCEYLCHCWNSEQCDEVTGDCATRCANGWMGPGCQYRDIALRAYSRHIANVHVPAVRLAPNANDGNSTTCSVTSDNKGRRTEGPWWRVYFGNHEVIRGIVINQNMTLDDWQQGFQITVENITNKADHTKPDNAKLCYEHVPSAEIPSTFEVYCNESVVGIQVRIQLRSLDAQLVLCDVNIFGGRNVAVGKTASAIRLAPGRSANLAVDGRTATNDSRQCSTTATVDNPWWQVDLGRVYNVDMVKLVYSNSDAVKNYVLSGQTYSTSTWISLHDDRQQTNTTDAIIVNQSVKALRITRNATQAILSICEVQVFGDCPSNTCGLDCSTACHCNTFTYQQKVTGICTSGCQERWTGSGQKCDIECEKDKWGTRCQNTCGHCDSGASCDVITGDCPSECAAGYQMPTCTETCSSGYYGDLCQHTCVGNCLNGNSSCNHVTGLCETGCAAGWQGERCTETCSSGYYGDLCQHTCVGNCLNGNSSCNHVTGLCETGCAAGWQGERCTETCSSGYYGDLCQHTCVGNCLNGNSSCNHVTGLCETGCVAGWQGERCTETCSSGYYGDLCQHTCVGNCLNGNSSCNHVTGLCETGCAAGWQGERCTETCSSGYYGDLCQHTCVGNCLNGNSSCNHVTGLCETGCAAGWQGERCTERIEDFRNKPSSPAAGIVGGIVACVAGLGIVLLVVYLVRRRRRRHSKSIDQIDEGPTENAPKAVSESQDGYEVMSIVAAVDENPYDSLQLEDRVYANSKLSGYSPSLPTGVPESVIYIHDLKVYVTTRAESGHLAEEFKSIPYDLQYPTTVALKPTNKTKNKYTGIYPYDHSRVKLRKLRGQPDTDYVNASYIDGYNKTRTYIAAQGPTESNVDDFLRMIWEKNVDTVVLFNCQGEKGKTANYEYWNTDDNQGMVQVRMISENVSDLVIVRELDVTFTSQPGSRSVTQYHFTGWDKTPPDVTALVLFLYKCRANYKSNDAPVVVHCGAGVGKTGTYIAFEILYEQGKDLGYVDVLGVVSHLREQRLNMVQTEEQYVFLHEAVYEALVQPAPVPVDAFLEIYPPLLEIDTKTQKCQLVDQYEAIQLRLLSRKVQMNHNTDYYDFPASKSPENKGKNRDDTILVADEFRPMLSIRLKGYNDYINAVFIQDEMYLPHKGKLSVGPFETKNISTENTENTDDYTVNNHEMSYKGDVIGLRQFVYNDWITSQSVPASMESFLRLVGIVGEVQRTTDGPILVHCKNGADKSGLFAVMLNLMERMKTERHVAIPHIIRMLRRRRPQIIPNYEQFKFCHDAVQYHLKMKGTHANI